MAEPGPAVALRDATLREGLDTPGVAFSLPQRHRIAEMLVAVGVAEAEVVAPARVGHDLAFARELAARGTRLRRTGLVYAAGARCADEIEAAAEVLDHVDLLMPLSTRRPPAAPQAKVETLCAALASGPHDRLSLGAGFPHATQADPAFLLEIVSRAAEAGARRIVVYDTNGSGDPFAVHALIARLVAAVGVPVWFHGHDDLGLATANAWAAVRAGAAGLDVTLNGLGDRAGNASLEQVALLLHLRGRPTGVDLAALAPACALVAQLSGIPVPPLAPVVGAFAFDHRSPSHLPVPGEFEAFAPGLVGQKRTVPAPEGEA